MRRASIFVASICLALSIAASGWAADNIVSLWVGNKQVPCKPAPRERDGVTYAPLRAAVAAVGGKLTWNPKTGAADVCTADRCVSIKKSQGITVAGSLLVPVRLLSEALGRQVTWDAHAKAVRISGK